MEVHVITCLWRKNWDWAVLYIYIYFLLYMLLEIHNKYVFVETETLSCPKKRPTKPQLFLYVDHYRDKWNAILSLFHLHVPRSGRGNTVDTIFLSTFSSYHSEWCITPAPPKDPRGSAGVIYACGYRGKWMVKSSRNSLFHRLYVDSYIGDSVGGEASTGSLSLRAEKHLQELFVW